MLTTIEGVYENGQVRLLEPLPGVARARVVVTVLPDTLAPWSPRALPPAVQPPGAAAPETSAAPLTGDAVVDHYQPRTELGRELIALRRAYILGGGQLLSWDELDKEMQERRGGVTDA